jgi:hypothetical protein
MRLLNKGKQVLKLPPEATGPTVLPFGDLGCPRGADSPTCCRSPA